MEVKLRRLALFIGISALVGFGIAAAYWYFKTQSAQEGVRTYYELMVQSRIDCERDTGSFRCGSIANYEREFNEAVAIRNHLSETLETLLTLSISVPLGTLFLFVGLRWVITGRWLRPNMESPNGATSIKAQAAIDGVLKARGMQLVLVCIGVIGLAALLYWRPERTFQTLIATVTQAVLLSAFVWGLLKLRDLHQRRNRK